MIRLSGLWKNKGNNEDFLSGNLGSGRIYVFKNNNKQGENDPDFILYISEKQQDVGQQAVPNADNFIDN